MSGIIEALFNAGFTVWNSFIELSVTMFTNSPKTAADGALYETAKGIYDGIVDVTVPLATLFFIIAIFYY